MINRNRYNLTMSAYNLEIRAEQLGKTLENVAEGIITELEESVAQLAQAAHAAISAQIQAGEHDPKNRKAYLDGLDLQKLDEGHFLLSLDGDWANKLESGYPSYDLKAVLLASTSNVTAGSRAGQPWVRKSKEGKKYAAVPFHHRPFAKDQGRSNLAPEIRKLTAENASGRQQRLTQIFKSAEGESLSGRVASVRNTGNPRLEGLTKYQHIHESGNVQSVYLTFRFISEDSAGWQHPGHKGYNYFKQAEEFVAMELDNIINSLL